MIPATLAVVRACVEIARSSGPDAAEDVVEELVAMGWTIVPAEADDRPAAA